MFWKSMSLRTKLVWLSMSGVAVIGVYLLILSLAQEKAQMHRSQVELDVQSQLFAEKSADIFRSYYYGIQSLSSSSVFLSGSRELIGDALNQFILNNKHYDSALFVDSLGHFQAANGISHDGKPLQVKSLEGRTYSETIWYQKAIKGEFSEDPAQGLTGSVVEDVHIDSISSALYGVPTHGLGFSRAVYGLNGSILGVVTLRASLRPFASELNRHLNSLKAQSYQSSHLYLINSTGFVLAEATSPERLVRIVNGNSSDRVLRWNLATQQGQQAASDAVQGKSGYLFESDRMDKSSRAWSFRPVKNEGFLEGLKWSVIVSAETSDMIAEIVDQRIWIGAALFVTIASLGLINYGLSRSLAKQVSDTLLKVKEEGRSLSEFCDNFGDGVRRLGSSSKDPASIIRSASIQVESLAKLTDESRSFMRQSREHIKALAERSAQSEQSIQRISVEISLAQRSNDKLSELEKRLAASIEKVSQLNEIVFKAQLISYNASIEASKAGQHGRGFVLVAHELESLVDGSESLLKEILVDLSESKATATESIAAVRRSLSDSSSLVEDTTEKVSLLKREFDAVAEGLDATRTALESREPTAVGIKDSLHSVEESLAQAHTLMADVGKVMHSISESGERIDGLTQALAASLKGGRVKHRTRRSIQTGGSSFAPTDKSGDTDSEFVRSDVVDRLAQKMRPRLVVEAEPSEPDVSTEPRESKDLRAG